MNIFLMNPFPFQLAIQASYGATRHVSIQTLISLQMKLCSSIDENAGQNENKTTNHRMSRIVTKLFSRVLKAEENEIASFSRRGFNLESVLKTIEETLIKCDALSPPRTSSVAEASAVSDLDLDSYSADKMAACRDLVNTFVMHLLKAKSDQGKIVELRKTLENAGLSKDSRTGKLFIASCTTIAISPIFGPSNPEKSPTNYDVDYLSELIYAVGGAEDDDDRVDSMSDLRDYLEAHKEIDIESHISGVSAPFRKYILEQLHSPFRPLMRRSSRSVLSGLVSTPGESSSRSVVTDWSEGNMSMTDKLRYLKSKINAAEQTANSVINNDSPPPRPPSTNEYKTHEASPEPTTHVSSLRQRLAAATERAKAKSPEPTKNKTRPSSAIGNAATLRARLESVRRTSAMHTNQE